MPFLFPQTNTIYNAEFESLGGKRKNAMRNVLYRMLLLVILFYCSAVTFAEDRRFYKVTECYVRGDEPFTLQGECDRDFYYDDSKCISWPYLKDGRIGNPVYYYYELTWGDGTIQYLRQYKISGVTCSEWVQISPDGRTIKTHNVSPGSDYSPVVHIYELAE